MRKHAIENMPKYEDICRYMQRKICRNMQIYACKQYANICIYMHYMQIYAIGDICKNMLKYALENIHKYEDICGYM